MKSSVIDKLEKMTPSEMDRYLTSLAWGQRINIAIAIVMLLAGAAISLNLITLDIPAHLTGVLLVCCSSTQYFFGRTNSVVRLLIIRLRSQN
jgi:DNA-directed RNA polymerase